MKHLALVVILASCGKGDVASSGGGSAASPPVATPTVAGTTGVVVTATDVTVDGKSLGTSPRNLVADRAPLVETLAKRAGSAAGLTYTDDASADVVLAALRAIDDLARQRTKPPPPPADPGSGSTGSARAAGEYKMQGPKQPEPEVTITAMVAGKSTEVCRAVVPPSLDTLSDERVVLRVQIGHDKWIRTLSRINEVATIAPNAQDLERDLRAQKESAFFVNRDDADLSATPDATGADLTPVIATHCKLGFRTLRAVTLAEVSAQMLSSGPQSPLSIGQANVVGKLDKAIVRRYLKKSAKTIEDCYTHELATKPTLAGVVTAHFTIGLDGMVPAVDAKGVDPAVASCVAGAIKQIEFPKPPAKIQVTIPLAFHPLAG